MASSVRHKEFQVHPSVNPGKAGLCCGFLETGVQYSGHFRRNKHQLKPEIYWLPIYMEITGQESFFWTGMWQRNRRSSCWRFPEKWFLVCKLVLLLLPTIISWCFDVFTTTFVRLRLLRHQEPSLGWIMASNFGLSLFVWNRFGLPFI